MDFPFPIYVAHGPTHFFLHLVKTHAQETANGSAKSEAVRICFIAQAHYFLLEFEQAAELLQNEHSSLYCK
jgi:hypothetical protein